MDLNFTSAVLCFIAIILFPILIAFFLILLKTFTGKNLNNPKYAPIHGTVFGQVVYFSRLYDYLTDAARKYPTFRLLGLDQSEIYTIDPRNIEYVLKTNFDNYAKGEYNRDLLADLLGEGIFAADGEKWKQQRKLASFEFSTRVLRDYSCRVFRRNAAKLVRVVEELSAARARDFDMQDTLMRCTLDSIFKVGFGVDLNCLEESSKDGKAFMKACDDANALVYWRFIDPTWKLKRFLNFGSELRLKKNIKLIDDFVLQLIRTKRNQLAAQEVLNDKEDILSRFCLESEKDPDKMNDRYLRDIILNFMIAGKDTSANTLSWFFYMLCKNPLIQEKVVQEIKEVIGDEASKEKADDFVEKVTDPVLDQMHYLHAVLTETLRLYPAVPADGKCAETDDILPDGYRVKKGDAVFYMPYTMGRMHNLWGEDAEEFKPERWIQNGIFQPESPFKFVAFNAGPRICLGKDFAYRQMKILSIALLHYFRFRLADETRAVSYKPMFTLHINNGLSLRAVRRQVI